MKRFWLSWLYNGPFEYTGPWWVSGALFHSQIPTICAAVIAESEDKAKEKIFQSHDDPNVYLEWRFCTEKPDDWAPFSERFPKATWMVWPELEGR